MTHKRVRTILFLVATLVAIPILKGDSPSFGFGTTLSWCPDPAAARKFPDPAPVAAFATVANHPKGTCAVHTTLDGKNQRGVIVDAEVQVFDNQLNPVPGFSFNDRGRTMRNGWLRWDLDLENLPKFGNEFAISARFDVKGSKKIDNLCGYCTIGDSLDCKQDKETACFDGGGKDKDRFEVKVSFTDPFNLELRPAIVVNRSPSSATYRFEPLSDILGIKLENDCSDLNSLIYKIVSTYSGSETVRFRVVGRDTKTGLQNVFTRNNFQSTAIQDTQAFATCP